MPEGEARRNLVPVEMPVANVRRCFINEVVIHRLKAEDGIIGLVSRERDRQAPTGFETARQDIGQGRTKLLSRKPNLEHRRRVVRPWHVHGVRGVNYDDGVFVSSAYTLNQVELRIGEPGC